MTKRRVSNAKIIKELRKNSRESIKEISQRTGISASTIKTKIKSMEKKGIIKRYTSVTNFESLNLIRAVFFINSTSKLLDKIKRRKFVNNLIKISNHYNIFLECVFSNIREYVRFKRFLEEEKVQFKDYFVTEELKREDFIPNEDNQ